MALRGLLRPKLALDFGANVATPKDARRALARALKRQTKKLLCTPGLTGRLLSAWHWGPSARLRLHEGASGRVVPEP
jgi:hypothetical protein